MTDVISCYWMSSLNVMLCQWPGFSTVASLTIWDFFFYEGSWSPHQLIQELPLHASLSYFSA